jgi:hypothetical protein
MPRTITVRSDIAPDVTPVTRLVVSLYGAAHRRVARVMEEDVGMPFSLPIPAEANALLDQDPLALLIGMTLDQQLLVPGRMDVRRGEPA